MPERLLKASIWSRETVFSYIQHYLSLLTHPYYGETLELCDAETVNARKIVFVDGEGKT